jgi:hypothetical protein
VNQNQSLEALRRSNPRYGADFAEWAAELAHMAGPGKTRRRWPIVGIPAAATLVAVVVALLAFGPSVGPLAVPPAEAMQQAARVTAQAAADSGTVELEITQDGALWVARTLRWNGSDLSVANTDPSRDSRKDLLVVDGMMYAPNPELAGGWFELGPPESVDPDSGTTPDEYLDAIAEDVGGETIQRITSEMSGLSTSHGADGSTVYQGKVPAGSLARETGVKDGENLRVLPFGYVAHDDAADPSNLIDISIGVGADGTIDEIHATWGGGASWSYRLKYSDLGTTAAIEKPANVEECLRCSLRGSD